MDRMAGERGASGSRELWMEWRDREDRAGRPLKKGKVWRRNGYKEQIQ